MKTIEIKGYSFRQSYIQKLKEEKKELRSKASSQYELKELEEKHL